MCGLSPEITFSATPWDAKYAMVSAVSDLQPLREHDERGGPQAPGKRLAVQGPRGPGEHQDPAAGGGEPGGL